jgi:hypothetical protein
MKWIRLIGLACLGLVLSAPGYTCSWSLEYKNAREHIHFAELVFEGVALGDPASDARRSPLGWAQHRDQYQPEQVAFRVTRVWKGSVERYWSNGLIVIDFDSEWSRYPFEFGERYLVVLRRLDDGSLYSVFGDEVGMFEGRAAVRLDDAIEAQIWCEFDQEYVNDFENDWFEGLYSYREVLQRLVDQGTLPPSRTPGPALPRE